MLVLGRRVGQSLKIGGFRMILRTRHVGGVELTLLQRDFISIKDIKFGLPLRIDENITVIPHPHNGRNLTDTMSQAYFHIHAPRHIKVKRDELEVGSKGGGEKHKFIGVMT